MFNNQEIQTPVLIKDLGLKYPKETSKLKKRYGIYQCSCGKEFEGNTYSINSGNTKSCGCIFKNMLSNRNSNDLSVHNLYSHRLYSIWNGIMQRTRNINNPTYKNYGARGISVCDRWLDIKNFIEDMYPTFIEGLTIDRINNDGNYEPNNCRWTTHTVQSRNTRVINKKNTSGHRGVSFYKRYGKWMSYISVNKKKKTIGYFNTAIEASIAYDTYVLENNLEHNINNKNWGINEN